MTNKEKQLLLDKLKGYKVIFDAESTYYIDKISKEESEYYNKLVNDIFKSNKFCLITKFLELRKVHDNNPKTKISIPVKEELINNFLF